MLDAYVFVIEGGSFIHSRNKFLSTSNVDVCHRRSLEM